MPPRSATVSGVEHKGKGAAQKSKKLDFLARFQDTFDDDDDLLMRDDGEIHTMRLSLPVGIRRPQKVASMQQMNDLESGVHTLTLADGVSTLKGGLNDRSQDQFTSQAKQFKTATPTLKPEPRRDYEEDFFSGIEDLSPGTFSASSPKLRRKSLSSYSENVTETDDTEVSEFADAELEDVDNIFGFEESGVYSSGGAQGSKNSKAKSLLQLKQKELQIRAEREEQELLKRAQQHGGMDYFDDQRVNTLKLKDFHVNSSQTDLEADALENERTVNYEYTRDDFDDFEDGFELSSPMNLNSKLMPKKSMPQFREPPALKRNHMKKYHLLMDVHLKLQDTETSTGHPFFNDRNNKLMRKLNRIPSFYRKPDQNLDEEDLDLLDDLDEEKEMQMRAMDMQMEEKKRQLLDKYVEITNHQIQNKKRHRTTPKSSSQKLGLVRCLNDGNGLPSGIVEGNQHMKYNPQKQRWEGNYIDLYKFNSIKSLRTSKPRLITKEDYSGDKDRLWLLVQLTKEVPEEQVLEKVVGNMKYDALAMKWVNMEEEDDIFATVPDLATMRPKPKLKPTKVKSQAYLLSPKNKQISTLIKNLPIPRKLSKLHRGVSGLSAFTQTTETTSSGSSESSLGDETELQHELLAELTLDGKLLERFEKEEARYVRKTKYWFNENERYNVRNIDPATHGKDYYWEIRKMVTEDET